MIGQLFGVGIGGTALTTEESRIIESVSPFAIILFARNVESEDQVRDLVAEIKARTNPPSLIMIDEEGGRVDRLRALLPGIPGPEHCRQAEDSESAARQLGQWMGDVLQWFDIDVNLAPVVDIERDVAPHGLERRCWGTTADDVVRRARAFIAGLSLAGVGSCLKHFPGMGLGTDDPHHGSSLITAPRNRIEEEDLIPFVRLGDQAGAVMIGHCTYTGIDPDHPASLSHAVATDLLRKRAGFTGVTFSDDMDMHAVSNLDESDVIAEQAFVAGNDVLLFCTRPERLDGMVARFSAGSKNEAPFRARVEEALLRVQVYRERVEAFRRDTKRDLDLEMLRGALEVLRGHLSLGG